jgi:hypothetical protein
MSWNDDGAVDQAIERADGEFEDAALIGRASAALEEVTGAESAMTAMMASLGAALQGFGTGITPVDTIHAGQIFENASAPWDADTVHQEARVYVDLAATRYALQPTVKQELPAAARAYDRVPNDADFVQILPELTLGPNVGRGPLPASPTLQPGADSEPSVALNPRSPPSSADGPALVTMVNENQPLEASLQKLELKTSDIESRPHSFAPTHSINLNMTSTGSGAQLRPVSGDMIERTLNADGSTSGMIEAVQTTATAPSLDKNHLAMGTWGRNYVDKPALPNAESDQLRPRQISRISSEEKNGVVFVDGGYLGRWIIDCLSRQASRPSGGTTGIDPRASATYPGAAVGV